MDAFAKWIMPDGSVMQGSVKYYMHEGNDLGIFHRPWQWMVLNGIEMKNQ